MIGIIGAMKEEVNGIIDLMDNRVKETIGPMNFIQGTLENKSCVVAVCNPGKVNSAICAQTMILNFNLRAMINVGVAGGIGNNVRIGDVVLAKDVVQYDLDTTELGDARGMICGLNIVRIPTSVYINNKIMEISKKIKDTNFHSGTISTGDRFISDRLFLNKIKKEFGAIACEMEGGSIGQVCYINEVDFAVIRVISDNADNDSPIDYANFMKIAAKKGNDIVRILFKVI